MLTDVILRLPALVHVGVACRSPVASCWVAGAASLREESSGQQGIGFARGKRAAGTTPDHEIAHVVCFGTALLLLYRAVRM